MKDLIRAKEIMLSCEYTCVICRGDHVYTSVRRGIAPLVARVESQENYNGFSAADKVVGKATAFLYVLLGVKALYAPVIGRAALEVLKQNSVIVEYDDLVDNISNRSGDGICPFEESVLDVSDPETAYKIIREKMKEMNISF